MGKFEKYLTVWVLLCIAAGIGSFAGEAINVISKWEIASVNIPVAILVWLMIYPMMVQIDFSSLKSMGKLARTRAHRGGELADKTFHDGFHGQVFAAR